MIRKQQRDRGITTLSQTFVRLVQRLSLVSGRTPPATQDKLPSDEERVG